MTTSPETLRQRVLNHEATADDFAVLIEFCAELGVGREQVLRMLPSYPDTPEGLLELLTDLLPHDSITTHAVKQMLPTTPACTTCDFCLVEDFGYSNYTVEGTTLACLQGLNPALDGKNTEYADEMTPELAAALDRAIWCRKYHEGSPVHLDVDREDFDTVRRKAGLPYNTPITAELIRKTSYVDSDEQAELLARYLNPTT